MQESYEALITDAANLVEAVSHAIAAAGRDDRRTSSAKFLDCTVIVQRLGRVLDRAFIKEHSLFLDKQEQRNARTATRS